MLIGAASERFVSKDIHEESEEIQEELGQTDAAVLAELREVRARLDSLEATLRGRPSH